MAEYIKFVLPWECFSACYLTIEYIDYDYTVTMISSAENTRFCTMCKLPAIRYTWLFLVNTGIKIAMECYTTTKKKLLNSSTQIWP